jgi:hypothetical protein
MSNEYKDYMNDLREQFDVNTEELNNLPEGWVKSFVPQMKDELFDALGCYAEDFYIDQAKEKWAALRVYWHWRDRKYCEHEWHDLNELTNTVREIIYKYTDISFETCMCCGETASHHTRGYVVPVCNNCDPIEID